ncbi:MAG: septum formation family protein [Ferrimicrobium sp.]
MDDRMVDLARGTQRLRRLVSARAVVAGFGSLLLAGCSLASSSQSKTVSVFKLSVGDCLVPPSKIQADLTTVTVVACTQPHTQQVFGLVRLPESSSASYPSMPQLDAQANGLCLDRFDRFVGVPYQRSKLFFTYMLPSVGSWSAGDRSVVCIVESVTGPLRRSVQGSRI